MSICKLNRRDFLKSSGVAGSGLMLGLQLTSANLFAAESNAAFAPDVFVSCDEEGLVTVICHRSEMGQGIRSSIPKLIADEMEADWNRVTVQQAIGDRKYGSQNTDGSRSIRRNYERLRQAGAVAREMFRQAATQVWKVKPSAVDIKNHQAILKGSSQRLDFKDLVKIAAALPVPERAHVKLKEDSEFRYVGKPNMEVLDGQDIVSGKAIFGFDVQLPDLKFAVIARPPVVFGKVRQFDASETMKVPGVLKVIELPALTPPAVFKMLGGVAVIATNTWAAIKGREKLKIDWDQGQNAVYDSREQEKKFVESLKTPTKTIRYRGDFKQAFAAAAKKVSAEYFVGGLAHAPMEPMAATARINGEQVEIWTCTQTPQSAQQNVMQTLSIPEGKAKHVTINVTLLGGAFGRKSKPDYVAEAAWLAHQTKWPVKVLWTREDEIQHGYYHSPSYQKLEAGFEKKGKVNSWHHGLVNHPIGATFNPAAKTAGSSDLGQADMPFDVDNILIDVGDTETYTRIGWVRSVTNINNAFAACSFADELAVAANKDPKDFLIELIGRDRHIDFAADHYNYSNYGDPLEKFPADTGRMKNVLQLVADKANWGKKLAKGQGMGIAVHRSFCSYVATVVQVSMNNGKLKLEKIWSAIDAGKVVNPDRVHAQLEGAAIFGVHIAFYGEITAKNGIIEQSNFHNYPLPRINEIPPIETFIVDSKAPPAGVGEPGVPPVAPAICNAIYAATGQRYRRLPLSTYGII